MAAQPFARSRSWLSYAPQICVLPPMRPPRSPIGLWLVPLGYLAYKSVMFPRALGILLVVGGACYLVGLLAVFLVPDGRETINGFVTIPSGISEISMVLYLLIKGVRSSPSIQVIERLYAAVRPRPISAHRGGRLDSRGVLRWGECRAEQHSEQHFRVSV